MEHGCQALEAYSQGRKPSAEGDAHPTGPTQPLAKLYSLNLLDGRMGGVKGGICSMGG